MLLGAVTYNVLKDWDLETIIKNLEAAGFEAVELRTGHKHGVEISLDAAARERVKARFERSKVRLLSFGSTCEFQSPDPAERRKQIEIGKQWVDLAHDTGAWGVKVRPNGLPKDVPQEMTIRNIGAALRELGDFGRGKGVEIWMEVHGRDTQVPTVAAAIMKATGHDNVGLCWNSNETDVVNGSVRQSFDLLKKYIRNCHINELSSGYPYREFFALLQQSKYDRYTLAEVQDSKEPERYLRNYKALWTELARKCA
jgi:sugar phosphate isomerase/epimerase